MTAETTGVTAVQIVLPMVGVIGSVGGAFLGSWLGFKGFRSQRWWDRKSEAYIAIFNAINETLEENDQLWDAQVESRDLDEELRKTLAAAAKIGWKEIRRQARMGEFLLSNRSKKIVETLLERLEMAKEADSYFEHIDSVGAALQTALKGRR